MLKYSMKSIIPGFFLTLVPFFSPVNAENISLQNEDSTFSHHQTATLSQDRYSFHYLLEAIEVDSIKAVEWFLHHLDLSETSKDYQHQLFHYAISHQNCTIVESLYIAGARDVEAFLMAVEKGNPDIVNIVLEYQEVTLEEVEIAIQLALQNSQTIEDLFYILYDLEDRLR